MAIIKNLILFFILFLSYNAFSVDMDNCLYCHTYKLIGEEPHGTIARECKFCHKPHWENTENPHRLILSINNTCLLCHDDFSYGRPGLGHPINGHPFKGPNDPLYPKKEFSCASCHNPHGSKKDSLLRYPFDSSQGNSRFCVICHKSLGNGTNPTPPWNSWEENKSFLK